MCRSVFLSLKLFFTSSIITIIIIIIIFQIKHSDSYYMISVSQLTGERPDNDKTKRDQSRLLYSTFRTSFNMQTCEHSPVHTLINLSHTLTDSYILSLSLSLPHTQTHTHSLSFSPSLTLSTHTNTRH